MSSARTKSKGKDGAPVAGVAVASSATSAPTTAAETSEKRGRKRTKSQSKQANADNASGSNTSGAPRTASKGKPTQQTQQPQQQATHERPRSISRNRKAKRSKGQSSGGADDDDEEDPENPEFEGSEDEWDPEDVAVITDAVTKRLAKLDMKEKQGKLRHSATTPNPTELAAASSSSSSSSSSSATAAAGSAAMDDDEDDEDEDENKQSLTTASTANKAADGSGMQQDEETKDEEEALGSSAAEQLKVWKPADGMSGDEQLDYDSKYYIAMHRMQVTWPCLSFDIIRDKLGSDRKKFPVTMYMVTGTQAEKGKPNKVMVLKVWDVHQTKHDDDDEDDEESDDEGEDVNPQVTERSFLHDGHVNRVRCMPQLGSPFVATWSSTKKVHIWDVKDLLASLDKPPSSRLPPMTPIESFTGHQDEGFAMDWSPCPQAAGRFLSGDCAKAIHLWERNTTGWTVEKTPFKGHTGSVEDIQWRPTDPNLFASCSVDKTIRIWDTRAPRDKPMSFVAAHKSDVNVISWNRLAEWFIVSGSDDGSMKMWDLRRFSSTSAVGQFKYHSGPITSVEWHPTDDSIFAASSSDNQLTVWDMSLEEDKDALVQGAQLTDKIPANLLFVHQGQTDIKELHFHPQVPGLMVSTAHDGYHIFKPFNI